MSKVNTSTTASIKRGSCEIKYLKENNLNQNK